MTIEHRPNRPAQSEIKPLAEVSVTECFDFLVQKAESAKSDPRNILNPVSVNHHIDAETGTQTVMVAKWGSARIDSITAITKERKYTLEAEHGIEGRVRAFKYDYKVSHDDYTRNHTPEQSHDYEMTGINGQTLFPEIEPPISATAAISDLLESK